MTPPSQGAQELLRRAADKVQANHAWLWEGGTRLDALGPDAHDMKDCAEHEGCAIVALVEGVRGIVQPSGAQEPPKSYYGHAIDLVCDEMEKMRVEEFDGRRMKLIAVLRNAAAHHVQSGAQEPAILALRELALRLFRYSQDRPFHHPACRKRMYDMQSSPCTCLLEASREIDELVAALAADPSPHQGHEEQGMTKD